MASKGPSNGSASTQLQHASRSHVAVFVRCLHLLDLDLLEDWPGVDEKLFTAKAAQQNLQQRVKAVEWSLYRLFELYDSNEARDKLRPFFPPVSQLQSVNLRAALYRCLTELKKTGAIGKDAVLRKTMLDDCKGERFEEVLAAFAMSVLRRRSVRFGRAGNNHLSDAELSSIIRAYRVSLHKSLEGRQNARVEAQHHRALLDAAEIRLDARLDKCKTASIVLDPVKQRQVQTAVDGNWIGDKAWADILLQGVPTQPAFEDKGFLSAAPATTKSQQLLDDLDARIKKHQARLSGWKILDRELASKQKQRDALDAIELGPKANKVGPSVQFSSHRTINLSNWEAKVPGQLPRASSYERLLQTMQQELSDLSTSTRRSTVGEFEEQRLISNPPAADSASTTLKVAQNISGQQQSCTEVATSPASSTSSGDVSTADDHLERSVSPSPMQSSNESTPWKPYQQSSATTIDGDAATSVEDSIPPASKAPDPPMSPSTLWLSLAERTRASMSLSNHQKSLSDPESPVSHDFEGVSNYSRPTPSVPHDNNPQATLLERTRQSLSTVSNPTTSRPRKIRPEKRTSQVFPVNQFETPGRRRLQRDVDLAPSSGASTPREELFDQDAEYASVFKSRPKLAMSPTLSPDRGTSGLDSILEYNMERLDLDSDPEIVTDMGGGLESGGSGGAKRHGDAVHTVDRVTENTKQHMT